MLNRVGLTVCFASLVPGCFEMSSHSCSELVPGPRREERSRHVTVRPEALAAVLDDDGELSIEDCTALCENGLASVEELLSCAVGQSDAPLQELIICRVSAPVVCDGRHHAVLGRHAGGRGPTPLAAWLQRAARSEMGSVLAFVTLCRELRAHGAPESLLRRALEAAAQEIGHARALTALAVRAGAPRPHLRRKHGFQLRPLADIAVENAVQGCVHETFSGLLARHQALHARDAAVREALARVAPEELEHAALAWDLHAWLLERLSKPEQARVQRALRRAARRLPARARHSELDEAGKQLLGLPSAAHAERLATALVTRMAA